MSFTTVGLTGGIATGKSTVARLLRDNGVPVLDLDQVARDIVAPGSPALTELVAHFGPQILLESGALNRPALRQRIIQDDDERAVLNRITHPRIRDETVRWLTSQAGQGERVAVVEAALMVETGSHTLYDVLLVVSCDAEVQLARLVKREGISEQSARQWIATQLPLADKEAAATAVVWNNGGTDQLAQAVQQTWATLGLG